MESTNNLDLPDCVYHYCSCEAFLGIIKSQSIWLSHIVGMNDYMEGDWLFKVVKELLSEGDELSEYLPTLQEQFKKEHDPFLACFSQEHDELSQWWAYGEDGKGFAIGFDPHCFVKSGVHDGLPQPETHAEYDLCFHDIIYDSECQKGIAQTIIRRFGEKAQEVPENYKSTLAGSFVFEWCLVIKNPKFYQEKEWRLIQYHNRLGKHDTKLSDLNYRLSRDGIVPYVEYKFKNPAIKEVILGPKNTNQTKIVDYFLSAHNFDNVKVITSEASYH